MKIPRKTRKAQAAHVSPALGGTVDIELTYPDNDIPEPGSAPCPTCDRALYPPQASAVVDLLVSADEALGTAVEALGTAVHCVKVLKDLVERSVIP